MDNDPGYLISPNDIKSGYVMADFADGATNLYYTMLMAGQDPTKEIEFGEGMTYFGLHYMIVSFAPYYHITLTEVESGVFALDYKTEINRAGDSQYKTLEESIRSTKKSSQYSAWQAQFTDETIKAASEKNEKNYKKLIKDIKEELK